AAFVQKGQTVVIKPNIGRAQEPRIAATTNPELVKRLVEQCLQAGKHVFHTSRYIIEGGN
ncbi:MAG TPA: DUF362 domain-containing protein, partial [Spirochaetia bacterium]|nr:DUF362 domain-containing protein [Spirochaetia bacterium]